MISTDSFEARSFITPSRPIRQQVPPPISAASLDTVPRQPIAWPASLPAATSLLKRFIDIVGALVGLLAVAVVIVPIAISIRLDSPGPILFAQTRYGYRAQPFRIWKFRSMIADADAQKHTVKNEAKGLIFKNEADY